MRDQLDEKIKFYETLRDIPFISGACAKTGIPRSTVYRWLNEDATFKKKVGKAIKRGNEMVNDIAYGKLIQKIKEGNMAALTYHMSRRHPYYKNRNKNDVKIKIEQKKDKDFLLPSALVWQHFQKVRVGNLPKTLRKKVIKKAISMRTAINKMLGESNRETDLSVMEIASMVQQVLEEKPDEYKKKDKSIRRLRKQYWRKNKDNIDESDRYTDWSRRDFFKNP